MNARCVALGSLCMHWQQTMKCPSNVGLSNNKEEILRLSKEVIWNLRG